MQEERAEEFVGIESQGASAMPMGVVSPQEADFVIGHGKESGVGDGNAVGIAREVVIMIVFATEEMHGSDRDI